VIEPSNIVERILGLAARRRIVQHDVEARDHERRIDPAVNSGDMAEARCRHTTDLGIGMVRKGQAGPLHPSPIWLVVDKVHESRADPSRIFGIKFVFRLGTADRLWLSVDELRHRGTMR